MGSPAGTFGDSRERMGRRMSKIGRAPAKLAKVAKAAQRVAALATLAGQPRAILLLRLEFGAASCARSTHEKPHHEHPSAYLVRGYMPRRKRPPLSRDPQWRRVD